ncbi:MAG: histidine phosphatase family protein [Microbacteriaceae bacterium]|jgi:broad specificity phosphatase PhoE|nr:histidine phosphatase family protein [Microbacteriaceae bacterium]
MGAVAATLIHLVRHGEVHNPDGILYGRIPGFHLSELGHRMAIATAEHFADRPITALYASPLERAQESAKDWSERFSLDIATDDRLIEPHNMFEGGVVEFGPSLLLHPRTWPWIINPRKPSWGEAFTEVAARMIAVMDDAWDAAEGGEVVMVSHQMPIVMVQRAVAGKKLWHDPRKRRCSLSSVTTFERDDEVERGRPRYREVAYREPAGSLLKAAVDTGAV